MPQDTPNPAPDMVVVLETSDRIVSAMAKGLLEDEGIPLYVSGEIATLVREVDPLLNKMVRLQVPRSREADARRVLEQFHRPVRVDANDEV